MGQYETMEQPPPFTFFVFSIGNGGTESRGERKCTWMHTHVYVSLLCPHIQSHSVTHSFQQILN